MSLVVEAIVAGVAYVLSDASPFWIDSLEPGMSPAHLLESRGAEQHGSTIDAFRLDPRDLPLVLGFQGTDSELYTYREQLLAIFQRRSAASSLRFTFDDGRVRQIDFTLKTGLTFARDAEDHDCMLAGMILRCGDPTFYDPTAAALTFALGGGSGSFAVPLTVPVAVGASTIDVSLAVVYTGTWQSSPHLIRITGPITNFVLTNDVTGDVIQAKTGVTIAAGHYVDLDTRYGTVGAVDDAGADWIANLEDADDLTVFHLAPDPDAPGGLNTLSLTGSGVTSASKVDITYLKRYLGW